VDRDGNRKRKGLGTVNTMAEAKRLLKQAPEAYYLPEKRKRDNDAKDTVASFIARWLEKAVKPGRTSTYTLYKQHMRHYVLPVVGDKLLHRVTRADVEEVQRRAHGAGVGASTIGLTLKILTTALNYAVNKEELPDVRNVVRGADRLFRAKPRAYSFLTAEEGQHLLTQAADWRYRNAIAVMLFCGLRVNEALGLRWQDIDLERGTLHVAHSLKHVGGGRRELGETKTEKSNRTITMPQVVITALRAQRKAQMREQAEAGDVWLNGDKLVFTAAFGAPASDSTVRKEFARFVAAAGLPAGLRLHDLRHSNASILGAAGVPVTVVSEQLGHSSVSITLDTYSHVFGTMRRAAADAMDRAVGGQ
jgi:integrase